MSIIYVASPYSSSLSGDLKLRQQEDRFARVRDFVLHQANAENLLIYSPIVYAHNLAQRGSLPTDAEFWYNFNIGVLRKSEALFLLRIPGWDTSKGVTLELNAAKIMAIPVIHFDSDFTRMEIN